MTSNDDGVPLLTSEKYLQGKFKVKFFRSDFYPLSRVMQTNLSISDGFLKERNLLNFFSFST
jgi:hypothetical protein